MILGLFLAVASAQEAPEADRAEQAEARRLRDELSQHAKSGRHEAVDRTYRQLLALDVPVMAQLHADAGEAALAVGQPQLAIARFQRAGQTERIDDLGSRYGVVRLAVPDGSKVEGALPFAPDERATLAAVDVALSKDGRFVGLVPAGTYTVGGQPLVVVGALSE